MRARHFFMIFMVWLGCRSSITEPGGLFGRTRLDDPFLYFQVDSLPGVPDVTLELGEFEADIRESIW